MKCRTIGTGIGSIIVGCGSEPCRCDAISAEMERVFDQSRAEAIAELEAELASPDHLPLADDDMDALESWLS